MFSIPKYRRRMLFGAVRARFGPVFRALDEQKECRIEEGHILADHVHMLINVPPKLAVPAVIGFIKGKSAIHVARHFLKCERNYAGQPLWARGYFVDTVDWDTEKIRQYKDMAAAVFVSEPEIVLDYEGPKKLDAMYANPHFVLRKGVKVTTARIVRVRPMVPTKWKLAFELEYDETIINEPDLRRAMIDAGALVGLGDWRPKFGRFLVK